MVMKPSTLLIFLVGMSLLTACSSKVVPTRSSNSSRPYDLDLASYRPRYELSEVKKAPVEEKKKPVTPVTAPGSTQTINKKLDSTLDTLAQRNKGVRYLAGYRIQLYTGTKRADMEAAKLYVYQNYGELNTYIAYNHPTYRLRVGDFATRLDAERYFNKIRNEYPGSTLISDRVSLRDALKIIDNRVTDKDESTEP
ncbi:sporulation protein [Siphonobacter sp. BAB-5385]|nr:sporulation protein [Siphonobacter sp. BAB-5385]PMD94353.1 sporulation protein [Siphonobacter sp. BAB-5405]